MKFNLPVWNGVKSSYFKQKIKNIEIKSSKISGIYIRKDVNFVDYQKITLHDSLKWKGYIKKLEIIKQASLRKILSMLVSA